jgi:hypothetical protein
LLGSKVNVFGALSNPIQPSIPMLPPEMSPSALASAGPIKKRPPLVGSEAGKLARAVRSVADCAVFAVSAFFIWLYVYPGEAAVSLTVSKKVTT